MQNVGGPPAAVYFVTLVNPYNPPTVIPPGLTLVQTTNYIGGDNDSLDLTERKIAGYQGTLSYRGGALVFGYDYQDQSGVLSGCRRRAPTTDSSPTCNRTSAGESS